MDLGRPIDGGAAGDTATDVLSREPRVLSRVLSGAPWYAGQFVQPMAVDDHNRVYIGDGSDVFAVDGATVSTYLTASEAAGPTMSNASFGDLDIGPDGRLYIVMGAFSAAAGDQASIVRSASPHQAEPWVSLSMVTVPERISVIADGYLALISRDGLWTFTSAGGRLIYDKASLISTDNCTDQDLAAAPSGVFLYQPGCNGYPLLRGQASGAGVGILFETDIPFRGMNPSLAVSNFLCSNRDPSGGFDVMVSPSSDTDDAPQLYHLDENGMGTDGLTLIETVPSFSEAKQSNGEVFGFNFCSIAPAKDGTIFIETYHQLWKVSP